MASILNDLTNLWPYNLSENNKTTTPWNMLCINILNIEASTSRTGLQSSQLSCWLRGSLENPQTTHAIAKAKGCCLQTEIKAPLLRTNPHRIYWIWRSKTDVYMELSALSSSLFSAERYSVHYQKRNININPVIKTLTYNLSCLENMVGQWWHRTCGICQPILNLT